MGRKHGSTAQPKRQQKSKRSRYLERQPDLDLTVRFNRQRDLEKVWR